MGEVGRGGESGGGWMKEEVPAPVVVGGVDKSDVVSISDDL
jgi:hypothetical protein